MKKVVFLLLCFVLSACSSRGVRVEEQDRSLVELRKVIAALIGDPRQVSLNQREYDSRYFSRRDDPKFDPEKSKERAYVHFTILGDRRPYDIEIKVKVEKKIKGRYVEVGEDPGLAQSMAEDFRKTLTEGSEGRNIIDDFRAF